MNYATERMAEELDNYEGPYLTKMEVVKRHMAGELARDEAIDELRHCFGGCESVDYGEILDVEVEQIEEYESNG